MSLKNHKTLLALLIAAGAAGAAQAEGLYVGGSIGAPDYHDPISGVDGSGRGVGLKLYGGYQLSPYLGFEGGYFDLGHIKNAVGEVRSRGLFVDAVGRYEFVPQWSLLGSAGVAEGRFTGPSGTDWSPAVKLGVGLQYDLSKTVALRATYDRYHFTSAYDNNANIGQTTVGVKVNF